MSRLHCLAPFLTPMALALGLAATPVLGQDDPAPEYRVELVILEPTEPRSDAWPVDELASFDVRADPGLVRRFADSVRRMWPGIDWYGLPVPEPLVPRVGVLRTDDEDPDDSETAIASPPEPVERAMQWMALEPPPASLSEAIERLTRDGSFRLVTRQAWLQPSGTPRRPQPARIRDDEVIYLEPVEAPIEATIEATTEAPIDDRARSNAMGGDAARTGPALDATNRPRAPLQRPPRTTADGAEAIDAIGAIEDRTPPGAFTERPDARFDGAEPSSATAPLPLPPVPRAETRVDGTVALVQRQFLHAEIDLHWREPVQRPGLLEPARPDRGLEPFDASPDFVTRSNDGRDAESMPRALPTGPEPDWQVHRLTQSRVIRADQWAYFDSDRFGVLLRATELPPLLPLPEPEPDAEPALEVDDALIDAMPDPADLGGSPEPDGT
jgi:hypothetical protein